MDHMTFTFNHLSEAFIQSDLQMIEQQKQSDQQDGNSVQVLQQVSVCLAQYT